MVKVKNHALKSKEFEASMAPSRTEVLLAALHRFDPGQTLPAKRSSGRRLHGQDLFKLCLTTRSAFQFSSFLHLLSITVVFAPPSIFNGPSSYYRYCP